jgi:hypothetical protein
MDDMLRLLAPRPALIPVALALVPREHGPVVLRCINVQEYALLVHLNLSVPLGPNVVPKRGVFGKAQDLRDEVTGE